MQENSHTGGKAAIRILSGKYAGTEIFLKHSAGLKIGRNPKTSNLVLEAQEISGDHCVIRYSEEEQMFYVLDVSLNGTFYEDDKWELRRMERNVWTVLKPETTVIVGPEGDRLKLQCI